jgi:hypothetical protein
MSQRLAVLVMLLASFGRADEDAKAFYRRATAAFALHHYSDAASAYEKAFELTGDPAVLYNAAQSHRLAGNKERALDLYRSVIKLYGGKLPNQREIHEHIRRLEIAIEAERRATNSPPVVPGPTTPPPVAEPPAAQPAPSLVVEKPPEKPTPEKPPVTKRRWFWPVVGTGIAVVVAGVTVGIVLGTSKTVSPQASFGVDRGN